MAFAAFGFVEPVAGALLQLIDVAAIVSALRSPPWDRDLPVVPQAWTNQLHDEHGELRPLLDELRVLAGALDDLLPGDAIKALQRARAVVNDRILVHEQIDEREVYPDVARMLSNGESLAAMSLTHRVIFHLASVLDRLVAEIGSGGSGLTDADRTEVRRLLYALDAILRLPFAQEEELFVAIAPDHTLS